MFPSIALDTEQPRAPKLNQHLPYVAADTVTLIPRCTVHGKLGLHAGLVGHNFLNLLELAKKNVLQPGAAVVPCSASLYVMGVHVPPVHVGKYDLSSLDKYRSGPPGNTF